MDQLILMVSAEASRVPLTVMDLLQRGQADGRGGGASSSSSSSMPESGLYYECEALRRWLNGVFEGALTSLAEEHLLRQDQCMEGIMEDEPAPGASQETQLDEDDAALVQKPPWQDRGRSNSGRRTSRAPRSRSRGGGTWSSASADGWNARGRTGADASDGNEHRPWRRGPTRAGASRRADPDPVEERPDHSDALSTLMGPQAWHPPPGGMDSPPRPVPTRRPPSGT